MKRFLPLFMLTGLLFGQEKVETSAKKNLSQIETQEDNERLIEIETKDGSESFTEHGKWFIPNHRVNQYKELT